MSRAMTKFRDNMVEIDNTRAAQQQVVETLSRALKSLASAGKEQDAIEALAKLSADSRTGYAVAAGMRRAELLAQAGDVNAAAAVYDQMATASAPQIFRALVEAICYGSKQIVERFES